MSAPEFTVEGLGLRVTITRSAGLDQALLVLIDGPEEGRDELPDGRPRIRVLLNDDPIFAAVPYDPPYEEE